MVPARDPAPQGRQRNRAYQEVCRSAELGSHTKTHDIVLAGAVYGINRRAVFDNGLPPFLHGRLGPSRHVYSVDWDHYGDCLART